MVEPGGIEPLCNACKHCPKQGVGHEKGPAFPENPDLQALADAWESLPENIQKAILALAGIDASEGRER